MVSKAILYSCSPCQIMMSFDVLILSTYWQGLDLYVTNPPAIHMSTMSPTIKVSISD